MGKISTPKPDSRYKYKTFCPNMLVLSMKKDLARKTLLFGPNDLKMHNAVHSKVRENGV
jgi:hypothetical protein